jgi:uncharacterized repeat protein (TIGR03806 family)
MKKIRLFIWFIFSVMFGLSLVPGKRQQVFERKDKLSEYGFFVGVLAELKPAAGVIPYDLSTPLFSNYAEKLRFIKMPAGEAASYSAIGSLEFPIGTVVIKNFYYPIDFTKPDKGRIIVETRLLVMEETGWQAYPYTWNETQTDAVYNAAGDEKEISYRNADGQNVKIDYIIPNKNQCKGCHYRNDKMVLIGPTAGQLNSELNYETGKLNQLMYWQQHGLLKNLPPIENIERLPGWNDNTQSLSSRARAYLDVNCGTCHHPEGPANTSGLFLHYQQAQSVQLGILKSPVAAGRGAGKNAFDIVPGKPQQSILLYRMQTNDPGIAMPELGREQIHKEGVALIEQWIKEMKSD